MHPTTNPPTMGNGPVPAPRGGRRATPSRGKRKRRTPIQVVDSIVRTDTENSVKKPRASTITQGDVGSRSNTSIETRNNEAGSNNLAGDNDDVSPECVLSYTESCRRSEQSDNPGNRIVMNLSGSLVGGAGTIDDGAKDLLSIEDRPTSTEKRSGSDPKTTSSLVLTVVPPVSETPRDKSISSSLLHAFENRFQRYLDRHISQLTNLFMNRFELLEDNFNQLKKELNVWKELIRTSGGSSSKVGKRITGNKKIEFFSILFHRKLIFYAT